MKFGLVSMVMQHNRRLRGGGRHRSSHDAQHTPPQKEFNIADAKIQAVEATHVFAPMKVSLYDDILVQVPESEAAA